MPVTHNRGILCLIAGMSAALFASIVLFTGILSVPSGSISDSFYKLQPAPDNIVVLAVDDKSLQEIGRWPWNRSVHAELIDKLQSSAVIGFDISFFEQSQDDADFTRAINNSKVPIVLAAEFSFADGKRLLQPVSSNAKQGNVNLQRDRDGVVRLLPSEISGLQSFSAVIAGISSPVILQKQALLPFTAYPTIIPVSDVLKGRVSVPGGKTVLVGVTAPDFHDDHFTPVSRKTKTPGVLIHAQAISAMHRGSYLEKQSLFSVLLWIFILSAVVGALFWRFSLTIAGAVTIVSLAGYWKYASQLFNAGIVADALHPIGGAALAAIACTAALYVSEKSHKKWVTNAFGKYVSKEVVAELLKAMHSGEEVKLGGDKREITVLFSDIRGFTTISEGMGPEQLVSLLNEYLTAMTTIILKNGGIVDKYIGDAIMAFWNAPVEQKNHAQHSCTAALEMTRELSQLQLSWKKRNLPELKIGVGINTGPAVVGNMGSKERLSYTAMGDTVNLASRLEGLTKEYGVSILLTQDTFDLVKEKIACRKIDLVQVKGKKKPILVYEPADTGQITKYEEALGFYFKGKFTQAKKLFAALPDNASKVMEERCALYAKHPPNNWTGVHVMTTK